METIWRLIRAGLEAVDPAGAVERNLRVVNGVITINDQAYPLNSQSRVYLVAVGKASAAMAQATSDILGERLAGGIVIGKEPPQAPTPNIQTFVSGHPVPTEESVRATEAVRELVFDLTADDLVICLISGGASALLTAPLLPLSEWQELTNALLRSGCDIKELNSVRQQLDEVKGGGLAGWIAPARCVTLILSDVIGNPLDMIGSGPTVAPTSSPAGELAILQKYNIHNPQAESLLKNKPSRSLRPGRFPLTENHIVADIRTAAEAARAEAERLGFDAKILTTELEGEAREVGKWVAGLAREARPGTCLILGGETTVTVKGSGRGGRNQELALSAAIALDGAENVTIASFATDGEDRIKDAAGAVVTGQTVAQAKQKGIDPSAFLENNDSYTFFQQLGQGLLQSGPTGTNVNDLIFILKA